MKVEKIVMVFGTHKSKLTTLVQTMLIVTSCHDVTMFLIDTNRHMQINNCKHKLHTENALTRSRSLHTTHTMCSGKHTYINTHQ